jgi:hypothetical protein
MIMHYHYYALFSSIVLRALFCLDSTRSFSSQYPSPSFTPILAHTLPSLGMSYVHLRYTCLERVYRASSFTHTHTLIY